MCAVTAFPFFGAHHLNNFLFARYTPGAFGTVFARRITPLLKQLFARSTNLRPTGSAAPCRIKFGLDKH
jgi:hypothetical protein